MKLVGSSFFSKYAHVSHLTVLPGFTYASHRIDVPRPNAFSVFDSMPAISASDRADAVLAALSAAAIARWSVTFISSYTLRPKKIFPDGYTTRRPLYILILIFSSVNSDFSSEEKTSILYSLMDGSGKMRNCVSSI